MMSVLAHTGTSPTGMLKNLACAAAFCLLGLPAFAQDLSQTIGACENRDPGTAISGCTAIINDQADYGAYLFEAYANRAVAELRENQPQAASADASQAIALNPENAKIYLTRARAEGAGHEPDQVIADTTQSIALNPTDPDAYMLRGLAESEKAMWPKVIADESQAIALDPKNIQAYWSRAHAYAAEHDTALSDADLARLTALAPDDIQARMARAADLLLANQPQAAVPDLLKVLQLDPADPQANLSLALAYDEEGQWAAEVAELSKMLQAGGLTSRGTLLVYVQRAEAEQQLHHYDAAIADATSAIALKPSGASLYVLRASTYGLKAEYGKEIADDDKAIALAPKDARAYMDRAGAYENQNLFAQAIPDNSVVISLDPGDPLFWNNRCWDRAHTGDLPGALSDCQQSLKLAPHFAPALDSTGYVYLKLKDYARSVAEYGVSLRADDKQASSYYGRALAEQALGRKAAAAADRARALQLDPDITTNF